jgi:hypothetical protein
VHPSKELEAAVVDVATISGGDLASERRRSARYREAVIIACPDIGESFLLAWQIAITIFGFLALALLVGRNLFRWATLGRLIRAISGRDPLPDVPKWLLGLVTLTTTSVPAVLAAWVAWVVVGYSWCVLANETLTNVVSNVAAIATAVTVGRRRWKRLRSYEEKRPNEPVEPK